MDDDDDQINDDDIKRLRASYEKYMAAEDQAGRKSGRWWVRKTAECDELECLGKDAEVLTGWHVDGTPFESYGHAHDFWQAVLGSATIPSEFFIEGFIEGALDSWREAEVRVRNPNG
jgi:hypothetical protein